MIRDDTNNVPTRANLARGISTRTMSETAEAQTEMILSRLWFQIVDL